MDIIQNTLYLTTPATLVVRVQKSVFECQVGRTEWVQLKDRLLKEIKTNEDSLRFYYLDETAKQKIEHHGIEKPMDFSEPLIL